MRRNQVNKVEPRAKTLYSLTDHACRHCSGGRILQQETNCGMTPGGNPTYKCADCGKVSCGMGPGDLCWCGFEFKNNQFDNQYMCLPFSILKENPKLLAAFQSCGCDPSRGEVGIMTRDAYYRYRNET